MASVRRPFSRARGLRHKSCSRLYFAPRCIPLMSKDLAMRNTEDGFFQQGSDVTPEQPTRTTADAHASELHEPGGDQPFPQTGVYKLILEGDSPSEHPVKDTPLLDEAYERGLILVRVIGRFQEQLF